MLQLAVATDGPTRRRLAKPLAEHGINVKGFPYTGRALPLTDGSVPESLAADAGFVYPSRLAEAGAIDHLASIPWLNDREAVLTSRNKAGVLTALSKEGVPTPETVLLSHPVDESDLQTALEAVGTPAVIKPNSTTQGRGVCKVTDPDSARGIQDLFGIIHDTPTTRDKSFLVQEYVPDARDIRAMVIEGTYVGAVERTVDDDDRFVANVHRGADATAITLEPAIQELVETVASTLNIPFLGVDLLLPPTGPLVLETNARPTVDSADKYEAGFYDQLAEAIVELVE